MSSKNLQSPDIFTSLLIETINNKQRDILSWLDGYEKTTELPIYSSVDIRDAGFKMAVVDTNLFPAGFNNICEHGLEDSVHFMREAIRSRVENGRNILIIAEEHTRNTWYLENIRILQQIIERAGFNVKVATFLTTQPNFCQDAGYMDFQTATDQAVRVHCFNRILSAIDAGDETFDLIIMNNDLTTGIPDILKQSNIPIYPSVQAGWHSRQKSHHFEHTQELINEFAQIVGIDEWLFSTQFSLAKDVDINEEKDRARLMDSASELFENIRQKYQEHQVGSKPYIVLKSDSGTYGMGVMMIEDSTDIFTLNRKRRNKMYKGKGSQVIRRYLLQEGVPTRYQIDQQVSEACIYQIENNLVGGFYRSHSAKSERDNLNTKGMDFKKMCPHLRKYGDCGVHHDINIFDIYRILARIAGIAAHREIIQLEANQS